MRQKGKSVTTTSKISKTWLASRNAARPQESNPVYEEKRIERTANPSHKVVQLLGVHERVRNLLILLSPGPAIEAHDFQGSLCFSGLFFFGARFFQAPPRYYKGMIKRDGRHSSRHRQV